MSKRGFTAPAPIQEAPITVPALPPVYTSSWKLLARSPQVFWNHLILGFVLILLPTLLFQVGTSLVNGFEYIDGWTIVGLAIEFIAGAMLVVNIGASPYVTIKVLRGSQLSLFKLYRQSLKYWLRVVGGLLLYGCLVGCGFILFVVPGIILLRRYVLLPFFIVDENVGIRVAMQHSAIASKSARRHIWTMLLILAIVSVLSYLLSRLAYGEVLAALLPILYYFFPSQRYLDITDKLDASVKD
jgi:hypothetical protein